MKMENLTDLADFLRNLTPDGVFVGQGDQAERIGFDMRYDDNGRELTEHGCGSACCIGGWVGLMRPDLKGLCLDKKVNMLDQTIHSKEFSELCFPGCRTASLGLMDEHPAWDATPQQAARAVEILRDTGKCDWERAMKEGAE